MVSNLKDSVQIEIDFEKLSIDLGQKLKTNLDLEQFEATIQKAQEVQAKGVADILSNEIVLAANNFLLSVKQAQETIYKAELIANKLKHLRHLYTKLLPTKRGKQQS